MKVFVVIPSGLTIEIEARNTWSLKDAIRDAGIDIVAQCGGARACATCHVHVEPEWYGKVPPPESEEIEMLQTNDTYDPASSRLSCQIVCSPAMDGLRVALQPESWAD